MVDKAVCLVWDMVTIVPPAIVYQPTEYKEEWHEKRITSWKDNLSYNPVVYFQPVLFYSALGHVGCKGTIGNTQPNNITLIQCQCLPPTELHK